jgi:flagellar basal body-associated protein FliL
MATTKKAIKGKKKKQPLAIRIIKIILIGIACAILIAAMVERTIHFFRYHI